MPQAEKKEKTWFNMADDGEVAEVCIYDEIGGWGVNARYFNATLAGIKAKKVTVRINSGGGSFVDACSMYNAIKGMAAEVTCVVDAIAASAASLIAIAGKRTVMRKNSMMMIHNVKAAGMTGDAGELRKEADVLDTLSKNMADMYAAKSGKTAAAVAQAMDDETWYSAREALAIGLADAIVDPDEEEEEEEQDQIARVNRAILEKVKHSKNLPEGTRRFAASISAGSRKSEASMPLGVYQKGGKHYVILDGKEHEIDPPTPPTALAAAVASAAVTGAGAAAGGTAAGAAAGGIVDVEKIKNDAIAEERAYRANFSTAMATAGITGDAAKTFEEKFYKRPIEDVKFLASNYIGTRAKPVGEGSGDSAPAKKEEDADKAIEKEVTDRWHADARLRKLHGVHAGLPKDNPLYVARLARLVAAEKKCAEDQKKGTGRNWVAEKKPDEGDKVSRIVGNEKVTETWKSNEAQTAAAAAE